MPTAEPRTLLQRLNAVQQEVDYVQKEKKAGMRYSIVSHDAVTAKVRPLMVKHGVVYYPVWMESAQTGNRTEMKMTIRFVSIDDANDYIDVVSAGYGIDDQDKGPGKAISYSVKYALLKALGLESGDDPDTDQETVHDDPHNAHHVAMQEFEAEVTLAKTTEQLASAAAKHKLNLDLAKSNAPGRYQVAKQHYAVKAAALRKQEQEN